MGRVRALPMMKQEAGDLAILGGPKAFDQRYHVGRPEVGDRERMLKLFGEVLDRRRLTNRGPLVQELETRLAEMLEVKHVIATCNGTLALEITERALGLQGEVIVPSFTFIATPHSLSWQGMTPVFCDIDPRTHTLDPKRVEELITPRTTAILGVHLWGRPCDVDALQAIADRHKLHLLFDAAHAFGCSHQGRAIGGFGDAEVFSFQATKFFNTLEGGAVATNDDALAQRVRRMKDFGFSGVDTVASVGTNAKMNEISAAMGLGGMESLDRILEVNRLNFEAYRRHLGSIPSVALVDYDLKERNNFQYVVIEVDSAETGMARDQLITVLHAENIRARRYFWPGCHLMEPYATEQPDSGSRLPETEAVAARVVTLPTGTTVDSTAIEIICSVIRCAIENAGAVASLEI